MRIPSLKGEEEKENYMINFNEHIDEKKFETVTNHLGHKKKNDIDKLIERYKAIFAKDKYDIGTVKNYEAHIDLLVEKYLSN